MSEIEYYIFIPVKKFIATLAGVCRFLLPVILITAATEFLLLLCGIGVGLIFGDISDNLMSLTIALLSIPILWCHDVLLAKRGTVFTRFMCVFSIILSVLLWICTLYTLCTQTLLLPKQSELTLIIPSIYFLATIFNIQNMAAAPLKLKIMILSFFVLLLATAIFLVIPPVSLLLKLILTCLGLPLLTKLKQTAPLIISLPPRE